MILILKMLVKIAVWITFKNVNLISTISTIPVSYTHLTMPTKA